jgi:hypothetical protein
MIGLIDHQVEGRTEENSTVFLSKAQVSLA